MSLHGIENLAKTISPRKTYLIMIQHVLGYLKKHPNLMIVVDPDN